MKLVTAPVEIEVGSVKSTILTNLPSWTTSLIDSALTYEIPNSYFMKNSSRNVWIRHVWDGKAHLFNEKVRTFLTGFVPKVVEILSKHYQTVNLVYKEHVNTPLNDQLFKLSSLLETRLYQTEAVEVMIKNKRGIVAAVPRSGKTIQEIMFLAKTGIVPHINICERLDLVYQTKEKFEKFVPGLQVGVIGDGQVDIKDVTVCTIQSLLSAFSKKYKERAKETLLEKEISLATEKEKVKELVRAAKVVFCDESHHLASDSYKFIFERIQSAEYVIGLSGTPWREDNKDLLLEGLAGPIIYEVGYSKLIDLGYLVAPTIYFLRVPKVIENVGATYPQIYSRCVVENEFRNNIIKKTAEQLMAKGKSVLIIVRQLKHGQILNTMIKESIFLQGRDSGEYRKIIFDMVRGGEIRCLISTLIEEGLDLPRADATIIAPGGNSSIKVFQRLRCLTPFEDKQEAIVIDFYDPYKYLQTHSRKRLNLYKDEPGFRVIEQKVDAEKYVPTPV